MPDASIVAALGEDPLLRRCDELLGGVRTVLGRAAEAVPHTLNAIGGDDEPPLQAALEWLAVQRLELGARAFSDLLARHLDRRQAWLLHLPDARRSRKAQRAKRTQDNAVTWLPGNVRPWRGTTRGAIPSNREPERCRMMMKSLRFLLAAFLFPLMAAAPASAQ